MILSKHLRQPPLWLCVGIAIILFLAAISVYKREDLSAVAVILGDGTILNGSIIDKVSETFGHKKPVEKSIIRDVPHDEYLAVCLLAKDQALDMVEFFEHHYYEMGIRRFWVMDDNSDPPLSTYQNDYGIPPEAIDFVWYKSTSDAPFGMQIPLINQCFLEHGVNHTWLAIIDTDEFLDTPGGETVEEILRDFDETRPDVGALGVNWQMHTSNHQIQRVESSRQTYLECIDDGDEHMGETGNKHVKSIVRPNAYVFPQNPHTFDLKEGFITVGEHGDPLTQESFRQPITRDRISLQHYVLKSWEEFYEKISRNGGLKDWGFWNYMEYEVLHVACPQMLKYFPKEPNQLPHHRGTNRQKGNF